MTTLSIPAHHLEARHVKIAAAQFAAGSVAGWFGFGHWQDSASSHQRLS